MDFCKNAALICLIFVSASLGLDICGLENVPKCSSVDFACVANREKILRKWYQTPEAKSYGLQPLDPLRIDEIVTTVGTKEVTLKNVEVRGISKSPISLKVFGLKGIAAVMTHNLSVKASNYRVKDLTTGETTEKDEEVVMDLNNAKTANTADVSFMERCNGNTFIILQNIKVDVLGGQAAISSGLDPMELGFDDGDFEINVLNKVARQSSRVAFDRLDRVTSIVPYDGVLKDSTAFVE